VISLEELNILEACVGRSYTHPDAHKNLSSYAWEIAMLAYMKDGISYGRLRDIGTALGKSPADIRQDFEYSEGFRGLA
jgi:hypothetical protein